MIAVICAMKEERDALLKKMTDVTVKKGKKIIYHGEKLDNEYYVGKLGKKEIVLSRCGVAQLYASISTLLLIEKFKPELIINLGVAGSLSEDVHVGDIVIGKRTVNWRFDVPGWDRKEDSIYCSFECDEKIINIAEKLKTEGLHIGTIVTGDEFIYKRSQIKEIKRFFPGSLCGEMEGYAVAGTSYAFSVPVSIIRSISDETLVSGNFKQFDFNLEAVCNKAAVLCAEIIKRY